MDLTATKRLRLSLTIHFAVISWLTAMLVVMGSGSYFLPALIFLVSIIAIVFVDGLEWFQIGRIGSYIGMSIATIISMISYVYAVFSSHSESGQLMAIAGLLVYPEAVLFLQRKTLRVFEQLAIFLLLEMIVAALVNDNILFGILLAPIMMLWVSALFLFSRYATLVHVSPDLEQPIPNLAELLFRRFVKSVIGESRKRQIVTTGLGPSNVQASRTLRRTLQSLPIGVGAIAFAAFFFYLTPRTAPESFSPTLGFETRVGLPKSLSIGAVGRLKLDRTPVMRVRLTDAQTGEHYAVSEPPYLRARVMDTYKDTSSRRGNAFGEWVYGGIPEFRRLQGLELSGDEDYPRRDRVNIEFDVKRQFVGTFYSVPPSYATATETPLKTPLKYDSFNMVFDELDSSLTRGKSQVYSLGSLGFSGKQQLRVSPVSQSSSQFSRSRNMFNLYRELMGLEHANEYRKQVLAEAGVEGANAFVIASALERHLLSGKFTYTLDLRPPDNPDLDPIEDFLINQRRGHCQYFASALLVMMRQSRIPGRIVVGYRPNELNKLGEYFSVKQSDAHAWVEGYFDRSDLENTELAPWLGEAQHYWVRFDPTPDSDEGSGIVEQKGQAMDYAEKLWKDYVVEGQKLSGENSLYAPVAQNSKGAYEQAAERLANLRRNLEEGRLFSSSGGIGFAWPLFILIFGGGLFGILIWRAIVVLPRISPRLARRLGLGRQQTKIQQRFFERCVALLAQRGFKRDDHETPHEFTSRAVNSLMLAPAGKTAPPAVVPQDSSTAIAQSLELLTRTYYHLRFGKKADMSPSEQQAIELALQNLENSQTIKKSS